MTDPETNTKRIGIDIGGSHITTALVDTLSTGIETIRKNTTPLNSNASANAIISTITKSLGAILDNETGIDALGIAIPGPFDYKKGVSAIANVGGEIRTGIWPAYSPGAKRYGRNKRKDDQLFK